MEKQASIKNPTPTGPSPANQLTHQDWETLIDDFQSGVSSRRVRWIQLPIVDLAFQYLLRKDFTLNAKISLLIFLEESSDLLFRPSPSSSLPPMIDSLRSLLLSFSDPALKEQFMISTTSIAISVVDSAAPEFLDPLTELLLSVVNRPNHCVDRHTRAVACECLRELELAYPLLLSEAAGHIWALAQAERTHAAQSYLLLIATIVSSVARHGLLSSATSVFSTAIPLVPFNSPSTCFSPCSPSEPSDLNLREVRRVIAFLLERPQALTPSATMELVSLLASIVGALELRMPAVAALLKVQFSGLLYCYDPILCHVVLMLYSRFSDAFTGDDELGIARRLALIPKEAHQPLFVRLLAIHWLLGSAQLSGKQGFVPSLIHCFYPTVFDPLSLKASKLDVLSSVAAYLEDTSIERHASCQEGQKKDGEDTVAKFFEEGLVCLSAFKWLPPSSSETTLFFRTLHKFFIGVSPHHDSTKHAIDSHMVFYSSTFQILQRVLVELALAHCKLVPVIVSFIDRLLVCKAHQLVGQHLFQTLDEQLLPKLEIGYSLVSYFPLFEKIASNDSIPPRGLVELLLKHVAYLTEKHGPETSLRSWSQGSKVLGICRTLLMHHHSSRIFLSLSQLLGFTCQFFPDLEVRDTARIYLRMLLCIPGKKLKTIMDFGGQLTGLSPSPHPASLFQVLSPRQFQDPKKLSGISSYIHLERAIPPLVKQSWSLVLPNFETNENKTSYFEGNRDIAISSIKIEKEVGVTTDRIGLQEEPLRVMDSKVAETLRILRMHFACIPDYRNMPGTKIRIHCVLWFKAESFNQIWESDSPTLDSDVVDNLPALYATTINFKSTAKYGSIPACHIPFLLGKPSNTGLDIVPVGCDIQEDSSFRAPLVIELEPREPMPGIIDTELKANIENGQIISGSLQSITVGIEDMFLKAILPPHVADDRVPQYYLDLFHALWEACGSSANIGRETFSLDGGKGAAAIYGTRSVKLLDVSPRLVITSVERYLAPYVVSVIGEQLVNIIRSNGVIRDIVYEHDSDFFSGTETSNALVPYSEKVPLQLEYFRHEGSSVKSREACKRKLGTFLILIFLPPRFHLLLQVEVGDFSLVRIRTDHWPCLAYIDEYLESLVT